MRTSITSLIFLLLLSCSPTQIGKAALDAATGGNDGISVEAQVGKENTKQIVGQQTTAGRDVVTKKVDAGKVETVNQYETPVWMVLLLILGWLLPSPAELGRMLKRLFTWRH